MTDETDLTFKTRALKVWAWCLAHPFACYLTGAFVSGTLVGWWLAR